MLGWQADGPGREPGRMINPNSIRFVQAFIPLLACSHRIGCRNIPVTTFGLQSVTKRGRGYV